MDKKIKKKKIEYFRIKSEYGVYILTRKEFERSLDRANEGVTGKILDEIDY